MLKFCAGVLIGLALVACQDVKPIYEGIDYYKKEEGFFSQFVNKADYSATETMTGRTKLVNEDYPIELVLFQNGRFYYMLETLGDGNGTWSLDPKDGFLKLHAERDLFDMNINVYSTEKGGNALKLGFFDRHGWKFIDVSSEKP